MARKLGILGLGDSILPDAPIELFQLAASLLLLYSSPVLQARFSQVGFRFPTPAVYRVASPLDQIPLVAIFRSVFGKNSLNSELIVRVVLTVEGRSHRDIIRNIWSCRVPSAKWSTHAAASVGSEDEE